MNKPFYKKWWGILLILLFLPFFLTYYIWKKQNWTVGKRLGVIAGIWVVFFILVALNPDVKTTSQQAALAEQEGSCIGPDGKRIQLSKQACSEFNNKWKNQQQPQSTAVPTVEQATNITPTRKLTQEELDQIVEVDLSDDMMITLDYASTVEGAKLYRKIGYLVNDKKMNGIPFMEISSDPQVDANPKTDSVQLGMIYEYEGAITNQVKQQILSDFRKIKTLAEEDRSLVLPEAGGLRLLVITYHDIKGRARGELEQLYIDPEPKWHEWK